MNLQTALTMIHLDSSGTHLDSFQDPIVIVFGINEDTSQAIRETFPANTSRADLLYLVFPKSACHVVLDCHIQVLSSNPSVWPDKFFSWFWQPCSTSITPVTLLNVIQMQSMNSNSNMATNGCCWWLSTTNICFEKKKIGNWCPNFLVANKNCWRNNKKGGRNKIDGSEGSKIKAEIFGKGLVVTRLSLPVIRVNSFSAWSFVFVDYVFCLIDVKMWPWWLQTPHISVISNTKKIEIIKDPQLVPPSIDYTWPTTFYRIVSRLFSSEA